MAPRVLREPGRRRTTWWMKRCLPSCVDWGSRRRRSRGTASSCAGSIWMLSARCRRPRRRVTFSVRPHRREKRERVIDGLLRRPEFVEFWTLKLADLLLINSKRLGAEPARLYHRWLREQVARNTPLDRVVKTLLTATGDGAAGWAGELLSSDHRSARHRGVREPDVPGGAGAVRPLPSAPVRPVDAGRLLRLRGFLRAGWR